MMHVERVKYVIWAADLTRATRFYQTAFGAEVTKANSVMAEVEVAGAQGRAADQPEPDGVDAGGGGAAAAVSP